MLLKFIPTTDVPPDMYTFTVPETGFTVSEYRLDDLFVKLQNHFDANGIVPPENWKEIVEHRICEKMPPGWCMYRDGREANDSSPCRVTGEMIIKGVRGLAKLVKEALKGGEVFVSQEEAEQRAEICTRCHFNVDASACLGCGIMTEIIQESVKTRVNRKTKFDDKLKNCCKCGCRNDTIVHIQKHILLSCETEESMLKYPDWCWKRNESIEFAKNKLTL